jgi:hypothetical protein
LVWGCWVLLGGSEDECRCRIGRISAKLFGSLEGLLSIGVSAG